ncbi:centrosomal protein of 44 kda-like [Plakobranchus ocellatus]|uniref:Centrosomal protein of 44 kDa n=1 Tax=Plakobranchus ocellatus TaxID=259542 RepID=A0AAV3ZA78_9GAST|nr:centrosomal protein of 44 kda-like [Plakobranchus ocellatus]
MATGDLYNNVKQLVHELKSVKYGKTLDTDLVVSGSPKAYLPIYNYLFTSYNTRLNADIVNSNNELYGKSDMRFMEAVYKILRDMFGYKAKITRDQFFAQGFSEHKVIMATDVLRLVKQRYHPPKSSKFRVAVPKSGLEPAATPEQVVQEPVDIPCKLSSKSVTQNVAGAIVLPTRLTTGASGFKIPKSGHGHLGPKHNQERPVFMPAVPSVSPSSVKSHSVESAEKDIEAPVRARVKPEEAAASAVPDAEEIEGIVRRKIVDLVSPALLKINERMGMIDIVLSDLEQKEKEAERPTPAPTPSAALINGLTKQMNDVVFQLQTLTSRVTLLENRVTMVEAQLNDEEKHRRTLHASQNYLKSKHATDNGGEKSREQQLSQKSEAAATNSNPSLAFMKSLVNPEDCGSLLTTSGAEAPDDVTAIEDESLTALQATDEISSSKAVQEAKIKQKDNTKDQNQLQQNGDSKIRPDDEAKKSPSVLQQIAHPPKPVTAKCAPFSEDMSPIRSFSDLSYLGHSHDESASLMFSIPSMQAYIADEARASDRRSSTPTGEGLDTSTLDRISRINQLMATTQQLLQ